MKLYLVQLKGAGSACVEAERYERGEKVVFFHGDIPFANYPGELVRNVMEIDDPPESVTRSDIDDFWG